MVTFTISFTRWSLIGDSPSLWTWVTINIDEENIDLLKEVRSTRRLQNVRKLRVMAVSDSMLKEIKQHWVQVNNFSMKVDFIFHSHHHCLLYPRLT